MKLNNIIKGITDVKICFKYTKEIKHQIIYNMILHVDELTKEVQRQKLSFNSDLLESLCAF